jgi:hypothetical protein
LTDHKTEHHAGIERKTMTNKTPISTIASLGGHAKWKGTTKAQRALMLAKACLAASQARARKAKGGK